jgi:hypothetical protein
MKCHSPHLLALIIMVNLYYLVVGYYPVKTRIHFFFFLLFKQWLQSMYEIVPKAIIMDQCQAMRPAIEIFFPILYTIGVYDILQ